MGKRYVSMSAYAAHRGCSLAAVRKARDEGRISVTPNGRIDPAIADREWAENTSVAASPPPKEPDGEGESFNEARARKERALADAAEMEVAVMRGEMGYMKDVSECWGGMLASLRARALVLPTMVAPLIAPPGRVAEAQGILRKYVNEMLQELSEDGIPPAVRGRQKRCAVDPEAAA